MNTIYNDDFKQPKLPKYKEADGDLYMHPQELESKLLLYDHKEPLLCKLFPVTVQGDAMRWLTDLKPKSVRSWNQLYELFLQRFRHNCPEEKK